MCVDEAHECRYCAHVIYEDNPGRVAAYGRSTVQMRSA